MDACTRQSLVNEGYKKSWLDSIVGKRQKTKLSWIRIMICLASGATATSW